VASLGSMPDTDNDEVQSSLKSERLATKKAIITQIADSRSMPKISSFFQTIDFTALFLIHFSS